MDTEKSYYVAAEYLNGEFSKPQGFWRYEDAFDYGEGMYVDELIAEVVMVDMTYGSKTHIPKPPMSKLQRHYASLGAYATASGRVFS